MRKSQIARFVAPVLGLLVAVSGLRARADLPETAIGDNTFLVAKVELAKVDPTVLRTTVNALLGPMAAMAEQGLVEYDKKYKEMSTAGAQSFTVVLDAADTKNEPQPVVYVGVKPGSDINTLKDAIAKDMAAKPDADKMDVDTKGDFIVMHKKGTPLPAAVGARAVEFKPGMTESQDKALVVVIAPNDSLRADMKAKLEKEPPPQPWAKELANQMLTAKYVVLNVALGDSPAIAGNALAADEAGASKMLEQANAGLAQLRAMADQMKAAGGQGAMQATMMTTIADAIKVSSAGPKFSVNIDLKAIAPTLMQILPMMMMGGGGGAAPAPAGN